jgi:hypothetical protein
MKHRSSLRLSTPQKLISDADPTQLGTLLHELGPYLHSRGAATDSADAVMGPATTKYTCAEIQLTKARQPLMVTERSARTPHSSFAQGRTASVIVKPHTSTAPTSNLRDGAPAFARLGHVAHPKRHGVAAVHKEREAASSTRSRSAQSAAALSHFQL